MIVSLNDSVVRRFQTSQTLIAIVKSPAIGAEPLIKLGVVHVMNEGGSMAVVVVVSPAGSVTAIEKPGVVSILYILSTIGVGLNTGAEFAHTMKLKVVVFVPPN